MRGIFRVTGKVLLLGLLVLATTETILAAPPASPLIIRLAKRQTVTMIFAAGTKPVKLTFGGQVCPIDVNLGWVGSYKDVTGCGSRKLTLNREDVRAYSGANTYIYRIIWNYASTADIDVELAAIEQNWLNMWKDMYTYSGAVFGGNNTIKRATGTERNYIQFKTSVVRWVGWRKTGESEVWSKVPSLGPGTIGGDVYAKDNLNIGNLQVDDGSVAAGGSISGSGFGVAAKKIPSYTINNWSSISQTLANTRSKLWNEKAKVVSNVINGTWYLNTKSDNPNINQGQRFPEGGVWKVSSIPTNKVKVGNSFKYVGRGTILVESDLEIAGNVRALDGLVDKDDGLAFVVTGNVVIKDGVRNIDAVIYSEGNISFDNRSAAPIDVVGFLAAKGNIYLPKGDHKGSTIRYDSTLSSKKLPGLSQVRSLWIERSEKVPN